MQPSWNLLSSSRPHYVTFKKQKTTQDFQVFWDMQPSWNLLSSGRPHYANFKKHKETHGFQGFWDMQPSWNVVSSTRPHYGTFRKPKKKKKQWFLKHFGICSPVGISYFRTAFKVHPKSRQDRPKIAPKRPKTSNMGLM